MLFLTVFASSKMFGQNMEIKPPISPQKLLYLHRKKTLANSRDVSVALFPSPPGEG